MDSKEQDWAEKIDSLVKELQELGLPINALVSGLSSAAIDVAEKDSKHARTHLEFIIAKTRRAAESCRGIQMQTTDACIDRLTGLTTIRSSRSHFAVRSQTLYYGHWRGHFDHIKASMFIASAVKTP